MLPSIIRHRGPLVLSLLAAVSASCWLASWDWIAPGPGAADPGYGAGADWDVQWEMAAASHASYRDGHLPHWDPYPVHGGPILANPEAFTLHPAWVAGALSSPRAGLRALYAFQCLLLMLGMLWLGHALRVPWYLSLACGLALIASAEWRDRLYNGHLMVMGLCAWPACFAALLTAGRDHARGDRWSPVLLGGAAGAALGLASLGGGHYPTAFGLLAALLLIWSSGAPRPLLAGLVAVFAAGVLPIQAPAFARWALVLAGAGIIGVGIWRSERRGSQLRTGGGLGLGLLAISGFRLVPQMLALGLSGRREAFELAAPPLAAMPLAQPWLDPQRILEGYLYYPPLLLGALLLGLVLMARVSAPLAALGLIFVALGWSCGHTLQPWELVALVPGMTSINSPMRLQWVIPVLGPLGLAAFSLAMARRWLGPRAIHALAIPLAIAAWAIFDTPGSPAFPRAEPPDQVTASTRVEGVAPADPERHLAAAAGRGLIHPVYGTAVSFDPLNPPPVDGLGWAERECGVDDDASAVDGSLDRWTIEAPPGTVVALAQRDLPGWRCRGGDLVSAWCDDGPEGEQPPHQGGRWLRVRIGETGEASCRWRTPGLWPGVLLQLASLAALVAAGLLARRR